MNLYFECTAKYIKMDENGREKKATETYLLDAVSFTEAEARTYKELQTMVSGEFTTWGIKRTNISEIIPSETGDRYYKAKVSFITVDEESGKEKRVAQNILVCSSSVKEAYDQIIDAMQGMTADFEITGINESKILDVFPYFEDKKEIPGNLKPIDFFTTIPKLSESPHSEKLDRVGITAQHGITGDILKVFHLGDGNYEDADGAQYDYSELDFEYNK